jgi:hypothetical protein
MSQTDLFYCVSSGVIADPPPKTIWAQKRERTANPFPRPYAVGAVNVGAGAPDSDLAALGVYRLHVTERGEQPAPDYMPVTGELVVDTEAGTVTRTDSWREPTAEEQLAANRARWADLAQARKDREAATALALPDSDDPEILRRKLNAALTLIAR